MASFFVDTLNILWQTFRYKNLILFGHSNYVGGVRVKFKIILGEHESLLFLAILSFVKPGRNICANTHNLLGSLSGKPIRHIAILQKPYSGGQNNISELWEIKENYVNILDFSTISCYK